MIRILDGEPVPVDKEKKLAAIVYHVPLTRFPTYGSLWPVKHAHAKIPEAKSSILSNAAEAIVSVVASPWVKCKGRYPRSVALASGNQSRVGH